MGAKGKFMGAYYRALDAKGRLLLPPAFIAAICSEDAPGYFWLTSLYGRITAYMPETWENTVEQICSIRTPSRKLSNFKTRLIGMAQEIRPDPQGRIRIPQPLMREGGLSKSIVLIGILEKFEIWDQGRFESVPAEDVSDELVSSGINIFL